MMRLWLWIWIAPSSYAYAGSRGSLNFASSTGVLSEQDGLVNVGVQLCDAEIFVGSAADQARIVTKDEDKGIEMARFGLGSERFGATYGASFCFPANAGKNEKKPVRTDVDLSLTLTSTDMSSNSSSYIGQANLYLVIDLICEDEEFGKTLYEGAFDRASVTVNWTLPSEKSCKVNLIWTEKSTALRPWDLQPTSVVGLMRLLDRNHPTH